MRRSIQISADLGIAGPANASDVARWMLGQRLDHDPGTVQVYSNFGYVLLGLILEQTTGVYLVHELRAEIFNATNTGSPGPAPDEIILGHSLPALRDPREPSYNCDGGWTAPSVYAPHNPVCWADGGWFVESGLSAGGLVASAPTLAWFLEHYWLNDGSPRSSITDPRDPDNYFNGGDWLFEGSMEGTRTFVSQHCSGYNYVALFNQRYDAAHGYDYDDAPRLLDEATTAYSLAHPLYPLPYASVLPVGTFGFLLGPGNVAPICTAQLTIDDLSAGLPADLTP
jgi:CubicO group peptidase (beta-lactamase class C family)